MLPAKPKVRYQTSKPLHAVKLAEHPGSSLRDPTGTLVEIPAGTVLEAEGRAGQSGLINVLWGRDAFAVFFEDLEEKARQLSSAEA
jgi:hypothetical protein